MPFWQGKHSIEKTILLLQIAFDRPLVLIECKELRFLRPGLLGTPLSLFKKASILGGVPLYLVAVGTLQSRLSMSQSKTETGRRCAILESIMYQLLVP